MKVAPRVPNNMGGVSSGHLRAGPGAAHMSECAVPVVHGGVLMGVKRWAHFREGRPQQASCS